MNRVTHDLNKKQTADEEYNNNLEAFINDSEFEIIVIKDAIVRIRAIAGGYDILDEDVEEHIKEQL